VYYELQGSGPPIVLIHEAIADSRMWEPQWSSFAVRYRLLRLDMAGFGRTPIERLPVTHARDVAGLLDELEVSAAGVVGAPRSAGA
jgi:pimeloyl-ACP methyl ester carboxylesterase